MKRSRLCVLGITLSSLGLAVLASPGLRHAVACGCGIILIDFQIQLDPELPEVALVPKAPPYIPPLKKSTLDDLREVPEVRFQEELVLEKVMADFQSMNEEASNLHSKIFHGTHQTMKASAVQIVKARRANEKSPDRFIELLGDHREDLRGLPFLRHEAARISLPDQHPFYIAHNEVREARKSKSIDFWKAYESAQQNGTHPTFDKEQEKSLIRMRIANLMQVLGVDDSPEIQLGLTDFLAKQKFPEATQALVRFCLFSADESVRQSASEALKSRDKKDYTDTLVGGLSYPWPAVAERAASTMINLERIDLIPVLTSRLQDGDPRLPHSFEIKGTKRWQAKELVRINHHQNCLLCHAPLTSKEAQLFFQNPFKAGVPVLDLPLEQKGYPILSPDLAVQFNVTYLRPDFSRMQEVAEPYAWPSRQRFDFLVRTRELSESEAQALEKSLKDQGPNPYRAAIEFALFRLTAPKVLAALGND